MRQLIFVAVGLFAQVGVAGAVAHHANVKTKYIEENGKKGVLIGMQISPDGYTKVRVNLGSTVMSPAATAMIQAARANPTLSSDTVHRHIAAGLQGDYVRAHLGEETVVPNTTVFKTFKVFYGEKNNLKPGDKVDVISTFNGAGNPNYWHVFGMSAGPVQRGDQEIILPGPTTAPVATSTPAAAPHVVAPVAAPHVVAPVVVAPVVVAPHVVAPQVVAPVVVAPVVVAPHVVAPVVVAPVVAPPVTAPAAAATP